jgi:replication factor C subunit 3/5
MLCWALPLHHASNNAAHLLLPPHKWQVMEPVRSRCLCVRVPGPSHAQMQEQMSLVARKEGLTIPPGLGERVALLSQRNLRRALLTLEVAYVQHGGLDEQTKVQPPDWELYCMVSGSGAVCVCVWGGEEDLCALFGGKW